MSEFEEYWDDGFNSYDDVNGYNSHECDIHNHGYYLGAQSQQAKIDELQKQVITQGQNFNDQAQKLKDTEYFNQKLQARVDVYELHIKTLKNIHENDFNEESESSHILGNLDGFFECIEADLKGNKDEN